MEDLYQIDHILSDIQIIAESYERVSEAKGEKFNIFSILQMESNEVATHSRFISELLNPEGRHGQKDSFLKRLEITPFVKKDISALLRGFGSYILYEFPLAFDNSLEYYKLVLKLHKFRKIEDKFVRENYDSSGYLHSRGYCVTPDRIKDCFNTVKSEMVN
jgi:hypothetical protein